MDSPSFAAPHRAGDLPPVAGLRVRSPEDERLDYADVGLMCGLEVHQQLLTRAQALLPLPRRALHRASHDAEVLRHMRPDALRAGRVRRHRADGVQDAQGDHLPAQPRERLHLRDGRHAALPDQPGGARHRHRAVPDAGLRHRRRGAHHPQAVPRRLDPDRLPAHGDRRRRRRAPLPAAARSAIPQVSARGGLLPRGLRQRPPDRLPHRPARHAADRDGHRARPAHARGGRRGDPADRPASCRTTRPRARRHRRQPPGRQRLGRAAGARVEIKGVPKAGWAPALVHGEALRQVNLLRLRDELHRRGLTTPETLRIETADVTGALRRLAPAAAAPEAWERFVARSDAGPGSSWARAPSACWPCACRASPGRWRWPTQPARTLRPRARRARAGDRLPRPAADPALTREDWPTRRAGRARARCARTLRLRAPTTRSWSSGAPSGTRAPRPRRCACATSTRIDGVPNETRQPFADGTHGLRAHPARARPHVPRHRQPADGRSRASASSACAPALPEPPWEREARYRGGRRAARDVPLPDPARRRRAGRPRGRRVRRRPALAGLLLRRAPQGAAARRRRRSTRSPPERWCELFSAFAARPALCEAWRRDRRAAGAPSARRVGRAGAAPSWG